MVTAQTVVDMYNLLRQHLGDSSMMIAAVRDHIEAEYRQAVADATGVYNAALHSFDAIHANLDDAQTRLAAQHADAQARNTRQHADLLQLMARIANAEIESRALLARARLTPAHNACIVHDPQPVVFTMRVYNLNVLQELHENIKQMLYRLEECVQEYRRERRLTTWVWHFMKRCWKPGWTAITLLGFYISLLFWHDPFWKGNIGGIYLLYTFYDNTLGIALITILGLSFMAVQRNKECVTALGAVSILLCGGWVFSIAIKQRL